MIATVGAAAVGLAAGLLGAAMGVGGGVVLVPGFVLLLDVTPHTAVGTSLLCVVGTAVAASSAHLRARAIRPRDLLDLPLFGAAGAVLSGALASRVPGAILLQAFGGLLLVTAVLMWPRRPADRPPARRPAALRAAIFGGGVLAGLFGVGGGVVFVPVLHLWGGRDFRRSAAESLLIIAVTAASGVAVYAVRGDLALDVGVPAVLGAVVGGLVGVPLAARLRQQWLQAAFGLLLVYVAIEMLYAS